jgi:hypothetical protein
MQLSDARSAYEALSGKASDIVRQLSLAGIALVWLFRAGSDRAPVIDQSLLQAALFIFLALFFDFLQYLVGTVIWFLYFRHKEKSGTSEQDEFLAPEQLAWPTWALFYLKSAMMIVAYAAYIIPFLFKKFVA